MPAAGISSAFNGSATGWTQYPLSTWNQSATSIIGNGASNQYASLYYNQQFNNFTYSARMKRSSSYSSGLVVRGTATFDSNNDWGSAYEFLIRQNGTYSVWRGVGGTWTPLKSWTSAASIAPYDWNILKVVADGAKLRFYINNVFVWEGADTSMTTGVVGIVMYSGVTIEPLEVDWANLGMSEYYKATPRVSPGQIEMPDAPQNRE